MTTNFTSACNDPANWWRLVGFPLENLAISGDLDTSTERTALQHLQMWRDAGITDIVDARGEWNDETLVARLAPDMHYHWVGTHDDGHHQSEEWFDHGVEAILTALATPERKVIVHCHMGVNRGPSLAFAAMLALGHDPITALELIRAQRPIAAVLYAQDAVQWWHHRHAPATTDRPMLMDLMAVNQWMEEHPVDLGWVISRIRRAERAA